MSDESLCKACGLCCDGTLFTLVPLTAADVTPPGLNVEVRPSGARVLKQPCSALEGTCCTVYEQRPVACRGYQCLLLEALNCGEESVAGALRVVGTAKRLIAEVKPGLAEARAGQPTEALDRAEAFLKFHFAGHRRSP